MAKNTTVRQKNVITTVRLKVLFRRFRTPLAFLGVSLFFLAYRWLAVRGDTQTAIGDFFAYFGLPFSILFAGLALMAVYNKKKRRLTDRQTLIGVVALSVIALMSAGMWGLYLWPAIVRGTLRSQGIVTQATVVDYRLWEYSGRYAEQVNSFDQARFIRVFVKLPDGKETSFALRGSSLLRPTDAALDDANRAITYTELLNGRIDVRYWKYGSWLVRPEIEFSSFSEQDACRLFERYCK